MGIEQLYLADPKNSLAGTVRRTIILLFDKYGQNEAER